MKRLLFILAAVLLVFAGSCSKKGDRTLSVITFNIRYDNPRDSINAWPNRKAMVIDYLRTEEPDLFGLQEALWHQYMAVDSALKEYTSVAAGRDDGMKKGEMNPVFFRDERFESLADSTFWLSPSPGIPGSKAWGSSLPRIVTWVKLKDKLTGEKLYYFNTHFAHDSDSARVMSAGILLSQVKRIAGKEKFVITGDFNMIPESRAYSILTEKDAPEPFITDAFTVSSTTPEGPLGTTNGWSDIPRKNRIDYVFVKTGSSVSSVSTIVKKEGPVFISDHWIVKAVVSL